MNFYVLSQLHNIINILLLLFNNFIFIEEIFFKGSANRFNESSDGMPAFFDGISLVSF